MELKAIRKEKGLTQQKAAEIIGVSRRTYIIYENREKDLSEKKYNYMCEVLVKYGYIDENHGRLTIDSIKKSCKAILDEYNVKFCYLFGSYAKGLATEDSDVDLLISVEADGLKYFELIETLRESLKKKVDLLDVSQLTNNQKLIEEILNYGVKIYG